MATQGTTSATGAHLTFIKTDPETCTPSNVNTFNKVLNTPTKKSEGTPAKAVTEPKPENLIPTSPNTIPPRRIALYNELSAAIKQFNVLSQSDKPIDWKKTTIPNLKPLLEEALTIKSFITDRKLYNLANNFMEGKALPAIFQAGVSGAKVLLEGLKIVSGFSVVESGKPDVSFLSLDEKAKIVQSAMDNLKSVTLFEDGLLDMKKNLLDMKSGMNTPPKGTPPLTAKEKEYIDNDIKYIDKDIRGVDEKLKDFAPYFNEAQGLLKQAQVEMKTIQAAQAIEKAKALEAAKKADAATLSVAVGYVSLLNGTVEGANGKTSLAFANEALGSVRVTLGELDKNGELLVTAEKTLEFYTTICGEVTAKYLFETCKTSLEGSLNIKSAVLGAREALQKTTTLSPTEKDKTLRNLDAEIAKMAPAWNQQEVYLAQINSALNAPQPKSNAS